MKKTLLAVAALAAISLAFVSCGDPEDPDTPSETYAYSLPKNYAWTEEGKQDASTFANYQLIDVNALSGKTIKVGDVVQITISAKSATPFKFAQAKLVDNSGQANYWTELSAEAVVLGSTDATEASDTFTSAVSKFTIVNNYKSDNQIVSYLEGAGKSSAEYCVDSDGTLKMPLQFVIYIAPVSSLGYADAATAYAEGPDAINFSEWNLSVEINPENAE